MGLGSENCSRSLERKLGDRRRRRSPNGLERWFDVRRNNFPFPSTFDSPFFSTFLFHLLLDSTVNSIFTAAQATCHHYSESKGFSIPIIVIILKGGTLVVGSPYSDICTASLLHSSITRCLVPLSIDIAGSLRPDSHSQYDLQSNLSRSTFPAPQNPKSK